jgi:cellulose synthase/poly-beta-1,6-N-acetylglucosamine synthase-like glycosyltransferase
MRLSRTLLEKYNKREGISLQIVELLRTTAGASLELSPLKVSIGICAYNEEDNVGNLLNNLCKQYFPPAFRLEEIIVVSSGSTDGTNDIVGKLSEKDKRIKLILEKERNGKTQALNLFFDNAAGDILVVVSADTKPAQGSVTRLVESIKSRVGGACAKTLPVNENRAVMEFCYWFLWRMHNRVLQKESGRKTLNHLGGDMWAVRKGIVSHIPTNVINDDAYLGVTLKKKGWQISFVPEAAVSIRGPATPLEYIQQRVRIVIGHKQIKEITNVEPTTIGAAALKQPLFTIRLLAEEMGTQRIRDYPKILTGLFLELLAQTLATINFRKKGAYLKWKQIRGTKKF